MPLKMALVSSNSSPSSSTLRSLRNLFDLESPAALTSAMILSSLNKYREFGLLLLRAAIGIVVIAAAFPIVAGGSGRWHTAAAPVAHLFHLVNHMALWGAVVAFSELAAGILLLVGLLFRVVCVLMAIVLTVGAFLHFGHHAGAWLMPSVGPALLASYALIFLGPGKYSFDKS